MVNMKKHLMTKNDFTNWLTTMYLFYFINRMAGDKSETMLEIQDYLNRNSLFKGQNVLQFQ